MCRHLAYLGPPASLQDLLLAPPYALARQSWAPRRQRHGVVNADGFGAGWYLPGRDRPVRYRRAQPIWSDASFASLAPTVVSGCVLAAVRSATPGFGTDESGAAPFTHGRWLFSHNGRLADYPAARRGLVAEGLEIAEAAAPVDSALLFGVAAARWAAGESLAAGLVAAADAAARYGGGRVTLLATDGIGIAGTVLGEPLWVRAGEDRVLIASEPDDDEPGWSELPDGTLVEAGRGWLRTGPLPVPAPGPRAGTPAIPDGARPSDTIPDGARQSDTVPSDTVPSNPLPSNPVPLNGFDPAPDRRPDEGHR